MTDTLYEEQRKLAGQVLINLKNMDDATDWSNRLENSLEPASKQSEEMRTADD